MDDTFLTIEGISQSQIREKMSRFIAFAHHVENEAECKEIIKSYQNKYHDARHVCWAYMLGSNRDRYLTNDNGEPSGTAGKPILGQINSFGLTDTLIVVIRYFGGIKLGTSGLIAAYRLAAKEALSEAQIVEKICTGSVTIQFPYSSMDKVIKLTTKYNVNITERTMDMDCVFVLAPRLSIMDTIFKALKDIGEVKFL